MFNWTFATKDKLGVFLELRYQVCNDKKVITSSTVIDRLLGT